jgi:hypothetical protein
MEERYCSPKLARESMRPYLKNKLKEKQKELEVCLTRQRMKP